MLSYWLLLVFVLIFICLFLSDRVPLLSGALDKPWHLIVTLSGRGVS